MKNNTFTKILNNWKKWSVAQKLRELQNLENLNAKKDGRRPRKIVFKPELLSNPIFEGRTPAAFYSRSDSENITFLEFEFEPLETIYYMMHEAEHATVDDFVKNKSDLKLLQKVDTEKLLLEFECLNYIGEFCNNNQLFQRLFDQKYAEEQLAINEPILNIVNMLSECIDSYKDFPVVGEALIMLCYMKYERENIAKNLEKQLSGTYEQIISPILEKQLSKSKAERFVNLSTRKKVISGLDTEVVKNFNAIYQKYSEWHNYRDSVFISNNVKERVSNELFALLNQYMILCLKKNQMGGG